MSTPGLPPLEPADEARIDDLLQAMTLQDKIEQMWQINGADDANVALVRDGCIGSALNVAPDRVDAIQDAARASRLGIPLLIGRDVIHGYRTVFPIPLGQAAAFDEALVETGARIAAREAAEDGIRWTFAPMVDIARDPRWGRIAESLGEDPVLAARLGAAMVRGFQGTLRAEHRTVAACAKHYVGYGAAEGGRDYNTTLIPDTELRNVYLVPFHACANAGALTFMSAFNDLNGIPTSGNRRLLRGTLKATWGFDGFVVSDWGSITEMIAHGYAADAREAAARGIAAGVDMEMVTTAYRDHAADLVADGTLDGAWLDDAVRRILAVKCRLGLFAREGVARRAHPATHGCDEHRAAALQAAAASCVLLKNENVLPLGTGARRVALIGPLADDGADPLGCWAPDGRGEDSVTLRAALEAALRERDGALRYVRGVDTCRSTARDGIDAAVQAARDADVAVLCLGEEAIMSGEAHSRAFLNLPGAQPALLEAVAATGTPVVLVIMAGRPLCLTDVLPRAQAVLYAWHPGTMGGPAIASLLLGETAPSGRLPVSFPATVGQVPIYYNKRNTGRPPGEHNRGIPQGTPLDPVGFVSNYIDADHLPLFPFGFGLTYTQFAYGTPCVAEACIAPHGTIEASVPLANMGPCTGTEVVQLYVHDVAASLTRPVRELKDFQRVTLEPGEETMVRFALPVSALAFTNADGTHRVEPGRFTLGIGPDARCPMDVSFEVV